AETGDLLWRKNIRNYASAHDARFRVYVQADGTTPADSPAPQSPTLAVPGGGTQAAPIAPTIVGMHTAMDSGASPNGWIDDCPGGVCTSNQTQTLGNNVLACLDRVGGTMATTNVCDSDAASVLDGNGRPTGNPDVTARNRDFLGVSPRDFEGGFLPPPQAGNPESGQTATGSGSNGTTPIDSFRRGVVTHLFYLTNWYHDKLYRLGFDEASGNFQQTNFSGMGLGNDRVLADAQDSGGTDNANFSTPPDGTSGRMQMYRFAGPTIDRDGSLDAEIVLHELTHGTSNRLVGNGAGLNWDPAAGLGEGWSDFYALSLLNNTNADDPNGSYAAGAYATYKLSPTYLDNYVYGIRRFPYSAVHAVNPLTWADVDDVTNSLSGGIAPDPLGFNFNGGMEVHNIGEIWANTLWGVRSRIIADPAGANGSVPTGNQKMLQLVTDALKMTPIDPTFTEARDAIIDADCATNACANEASIWAGFADRGLGYGASAPYRAVTAYYASHMGIKESFSLPFLEVANVATDVTIIDSAPNNNNGAIDPGEAIRLTVKLTNPWRAATKVAVGVTATLTTTTPGITIYGNSSTYGSIAPQGSATGNSLLFTVGPGVLCGSAIDFTLTTVSNLGTTATTFQLRVGTPNGNNPVVTYTGTPSPALAIPDNRPRGVKHQINVTDDFLIADLNFRIDSITHTWTGDLTAMLRSPDGLGVDLVSLIGIVSNPPPNGGSSGDNITNMVIDDDVPVTKANDLGQALASAAPYTKSWQPIFNSPWATTFGLSADPVGNLTRYNGTSTKGVWSILVSDQAPPDTGTLNAWSILVTPVKFVCAAVVPSVTITALKTVAGAFRVGGNVTYTVIVTNNGTANQADNPGNEFTDVLPAGLTLVSAAATSGAAVATIGTST
ncbi:MAG: M36 family metallopeptidase, partial [Betaproteobacteria bacterium]